MRREETPVREQEEGEEKLRGNVRDLHAFLNVRGRMGAEEVREEDDDEAEEVLQQGQKQEEL